jgi:hypothetical protein
MTRVPTIDGISHTFVSRSHRTDRDLTLRNVDCAARFLQECPEPASRLDAPRSHEDAVVNHDNPDADEAVRPGAGSDAQAFPPQKVPNMSKFPKPFP